MSKPEKRKYTAKARQYIVVCYGLTIDQTFLSTLGLKSAIGYYNDGDADQRAATALLHSTKPIQTNLFKANFVRYLSSHAPEFSRKPFFPEYDGVLACSGTNEKQCFNAYLKLIKQFDILSLSYFSLENEGGGDDDDDDDDEPAAATLDQKKGREKRCDHRFKHLIMQYTIPAPTTQKEKISSYAQQLLPFVYNNDSIFKSLQIIQMKTTTLSGTEDSESVFATLFTFQNKHGKHALAECVANYNKWFPESPIHMVGDVLGCCKNVKTSNEEKKCEIKQFSNILEAMHNSGGVITGEDDDDNDVYTGDCYCVWNRYVGWISKNAVERRRLRDIVIIYHNQSDISEQYEIKKIPFFIQCYGVMQPMKAFPQGGATGVNISDLKTVHIGGGFYISKMRVVSETNMRALLNHVGKYIVTNSLHNKIIVNRECSFTVEIPADLGLSVGKCGFFVSGDSEYSSALEYLSLGSSK